MPEELSGIQRDIIWALIHHGPTYSKQIHRYLLDMDAYKDLDFQRVYSNVNRMTEMGVLRKLDHDGRKKPFEVTMDGMDWARKNTDMWNQAVYNE